MKKILFFFVLCLSYLSLQAQDVIFYKNGDEVEARVVKIGSDVIEYKKWSNVDGPSYEVAKKEIFMIKYQNGEKDVFKDSEASKNEESSSVRPGLVELPVDFRNAEIVNMYEACLNELDFSTFKVKSKAAWCFTGFWAIHPDSKISNSEIEAEIVPSPNIAKVVADNGSVGGAYYIKLTNKTSSDIFVDRTNCFRIDPQGMSECYYDNKIQTVTTEGGKGGAVNLGGIAGALGATGPIGTLASAVTIGGSSSTSKSTMYADEQLLSIPPFGSSFLEEDDYVKTSNSKYENMGGHEDFMFVLKGELINEQEIRDFTPKTSPSTYRIIITYSTKADFSAYSRLEFVFYVAKIVGAAIYVDYSPKHGMRLCSTPAVKGFELYNLDFDHYIMSYSANATIR